jgi:hypothetical protein
VHGSDKFLLPPQHTFIHAVHIQYETKSELLNIRSPTKKFLKFDICMQTACSIVIGRLVSQPVSFVNQSDMWHRANCTCSFFVGYFNVVLALFCDFVDLLIWLM